MRRFLSFLFVFLILFSVAFADDIVIGDNAQFDLISDTDDGVGSASDEPAASTDSDGLFVDFSQNSEEMKNAFIWPDSGYPVYLVDPPFQEDDLADTLALNDGTYLGPITTSIYEYFRDITAGLPIGSDYVFYRADTYNYRLVYSDNLTLSGNVFSGSAVNVINYYSYSGSNSNRITRYSDSNFHLTDSGGFVYSSLGYGYPAMYSGVSSRAFNSLFILVAVSVLFVFISRIFGR